MTLCCPTCFANPSFPRTVVSADRSRNLEQCVDPCHDEHVLGRPGRDSTFLRDAIKRWRGTTRQASLRMYGVPKPPLVEQPAWAA